MTCDSRVPDYSGYIVSKFHVDWVKTQGEIASQKHLIRIICVKTEPKLDSSSRRKSEN